MSINQEFSLLLVSLAVAILPGVSRLLRLPAPVVEILFGVVMGKSLLNLQFSGDWLPFLAHLGFLLLMFHSGMEIDFDMLRKQSWKELLFQLLVFGASLGLSFAAAIHLGRGVFVALVLTTTSLGLVMPILKEMGISRAPFGQKMLIAASLADFLTLFGITFFVLGKDYGFSWRFIAPIPLFAGFALLLWAGRMWVWWHPQQAEKLLGASDSQELGVRLSLALLFLFVAESELVHLEPVLGAFMGGCVLSFVFRQKPDLEIKLSALGFGFLIPIFFINVGMQFDLHNILAVDQLIFTLKLLILAILVKVIPSLLFYFQDFPLRKSLQAGALLSSRLSLIVAAATIGLEKGLIDQQMKDSVVLLALLTCLFGPTLFKLCYHKAADTA
ncbi:cation:proton antiporter [Desulfoferrobacter suflitae]|uniref:cation:proton antiporter n=1 Tax=Desulfoferrobacter suflitae TaxID=2865782 RepID=UPI0021647F9D|nr:cation:proton antiporter [Desulfoferrobacter suflitae]MCK8601409.1 cation:proton antiporter [Desulfoferrobacter suflitae]